MYIKEIELENIRGFENLKFSLQRSLNRYAGLTIFVGDNGSGKSSLLKAIAVALIGPETARGLQPSFAGWIHKNQTSGTIKLQIHPEDGDKFMGQGKTSTAPFWVHLELSQTQDAKDIRIQPYYRSDKSKRARESLWGSSEGWFSCGYGPFRRIFGASSDATRQMAAANTGVFVTLFNESASLAEVDTWLKELDYKRLEGKPEAKYQLELVLKLLNHNFLPNNMKVRLVNSEGIQLQDQAGTTLSWDDMSDGYRAMLALLADIMRHLISRFGYRNLLNERDDNLVVNASGVVLIDELDAHLHPEWQIVVGQWLKQHFPKIQFLVTTHSPLICQAADENGLFILPEPGSKQQPKAVSREERLKIVNSRSDVILRTLFGLQNTRSEQAIANRQRFNQLRAKQRAVKLSPEEVKELQSIESILENEED
jgi:predicted ATPase